MDQASTSQPCYLIWKFHRNLNALTLLTFLSHTNVYLKKTRKIKPCLFSAGRKRSNIESIGREILHCKTGMNNWTWRVNQKQRLDSLAQAYSLDGQSQPSYYRESQISLEEDQYLCFRCLFKLLLLQASFLLGPFMWITRSCFSSDLPLSADVQSLFSI